MSYLLLGTGGGGAPPGDPGALSDLASWFDAGMSGADLPADTSVWGDAADGRVRHAQTTPAKRMELVSDGGNGQPAMKPDGIDDRYVSPAYSLGSNLTFFFRVEMPGLTDGTRMLFMWRLTAPGDESIEIQFDDGDLRTTLERPAGGGTTRKEWSFVPGAFTTIRIQHDGTNAGHKLFFDSVEQSPTANPSSSDPGQSTFSNQSFVGSHAADVQFYEKHIIGGLIYNATLSAGEITQAEAYLESI